MTRLAAATALALALLQAPARLEGTFAPPPIASLFLPTPHQPAQIVQEHFALYCGAAAPTTVAEWHKRADAIVHVRLDSQVTYDHQYLTDGTSDVMTAHEATVLDVFKAHPRAMPPGSSMRIMQRGGIIERPDGWHRYRANDFDIMPAGSEWVLFLFWHPHWPSSRSCNSRRARSRSRATR